MQTSTALPAGTASIKINPMLMTTVTESMTRILTPPVIPCPLAKDSRLLLYSLVPLNQRASLSELFAKHTAAKSKNGKVGSRGIKEPAAPRPTPIRPARMSSVFLIVLFAFILYSLGDHPSDKSWCYTDSFDVFIPGQDVMVSLRSIFK